MKRLVESKRCESIPQSGGIVRYAVAVQGAVAFHDVGDKIWWEHGARCKSLFDHAVAVVVLVAAYKSYPVFLTTCPIHYLLTYAVVNGQPRYPDGPSILLVDSSRVACSVLQPPRQRCRCGAIAS